MSSAVETSFLAIQGLDFRHLHPRSGDFLATKLGRFRFSEKVDWNSERNGARKIPSK